MKPANTAALLALVACAILAALLMRAREDLAIAQAQNAALQSANRDLTAQLGDAQESRIDPGILKRLEADQREAIKLRGEVAKLKTSLADAQAAATNAEKNAASLAGKLQNTIQTGIPVEFNPAVRRHTSKTVANLPQGHAVTLGGWETKPGRRTFAFVSPALDPSSPDTVALNAKFVEVSAEAAASLNLPSLLGNSGQQSTLSREQYDALVKQIEQTSGADLLSSPSVMTFSGRQARVSITEQRNTPGGPVDFGPQVDFIPTRKPDGTIDLAVEATMTMQTGDITASK